MLDNKRNRRRSKMNEIYVCTFPRLPVTDVITSPQSVIYTKWPDRVEIARLGGYSANRNLNLLAIEKGVSNSMPFPANYCRFSFMDLAICCDLLRFLGWILAIVWDLSIYLSTYYADPAWPFDLEKYQMYWIFIQTYLHIHIFKSYSFSFQI